MEFHPSFATTASTGWKIIPHFYFSFQQWIAKEYLSKKDKRNALKVAENLAFTENIFRQLNWRRDWYNVRKIGSEGFRLGGT